VADVERLGSGGPWEDVVGYARVVRVGDMAWTAGCTSTVDGEVQHPDDAFAQAVVAFESALFALARVGFDVGDVVQTRMYVSRAEDTDAVGRAHAQLFGDVRPAATMLVVAGFVDPRMLVEVEVVAARPARPVTG
jgi:enamine deaminase RidA (YjgF/YER057c/UK114 family)